MDEIVMQKRLRKVTIFVICTAALLLIVGSFIFLYLYQGLNTAARRQMQAEVMEYRSRIMRQIDKDLQTLHTLAGFLEYSDMENEDLLVQGMQKANSENEFVSMALMPTEGIGLKTSLNDGIDGNSSLDSMSEEAQTAIRQAWQGGSHISHLFHGKESNERVFVYAVPVYRQDKIIAALTASSHVEIFSDILAGDTVLGGSGYLHLIGSEGDFLVKSSKMVVQEAVDNLFDGPYIEPKEQDEIKKALKRQESIFSSFRYRGRTYQIFLNPVGINGWYLLCVNTRQNINQSIYQMVIVVWISFLVILALVIFLLLYGWRLLRKNNRELVRLAYQDTLTGADNMVRFTKKLKIALDKPGSCALAAINVRQFKFINEIFGKEQGDRLLCFMKQVIEDELEEGEFLCRDFADRFYLFLRQGDREQIRIRLQKIIQRIEDVSIRIQNSYQLRLYCGVAVREKEETDQSLLAHLPFALAKARVTPGVHLWFYDAQLHKQEELDHYVETHMDQALRDEEFHLYLQPKMLLKDGSLGGAEALVRWITKENNIISPAQFIPLFEKNGFCVKLDLYMARRVCMQLRQWIDKGISPIPISVNQSKLLFYEIDYVQALSDLVEEYQVPPELITLEFLEGLAIENIDEVNEKIEQLKAKGFRISMDDFGTGYSSLNILGNLKIDELKLDRSFLQEVFQKGNHRCKIIMEQIIRMTKRLHVDTVMEGVETEENEALVKDLGCDYGQGYYYSRPITAAEFSRQFMGEIVSMARDHSEP